MKRLIRTVLSLMPCILFLPCAVAELKLEERWRFTNSALIRATAAVMGGYDNLWIGGAWSSPTNPSPIPKVIRIDAQGFLVSQYTSGEYCMRGVERLVADKQENVFCSFRGFTNPENTAFLIKISGTGTELWRVTESNALASAESYVSDLVTDPLENIYWMVVRNDLIPVVSKWKPDGTLVWRTILPGPFTMFLGGSFQTLALLPDGRLAAVLAEYGPATGYFYGKCVLLDSQGQVERVIGGPAAPHFAGKLFNTCRALSNNVICAAGIGGYVVFSPQGNVLGTSGSRYPYTEVVREYPAEGFLLNVNYGVFPMLVDETGKAKWRMPQYFAGCAGLAGISNEICSVGSYVGGEHYSIFDSSGSGIERTALEGYELPGYPSDPYGFLLSARDQTLRLVLNRRRNQIDPTKVIVSSLAGREFTATPVVMILPEDTLWDGTNAVDLTVAGDEAFPVSYQWRLGNSVVPGATNRTLTIPPEHLPESAGLYSADVRNSQGTILSRMAEVRLGKVFTKMQMDNSGGTLSVLADYGAGFRAEWSTNLTEWFPGPVTNNPSFSATFGFPASPQRFFRTIAIP